MSTTNLSNLDPETRVAYQLSKIVSPTSTGDAWNAMGGEQFLRSMANTFIQKTGITDLENLGVRPKTQPTSQMAPMIGGRRLTPEEARVLRRQGVAVNVVEEPPQYYNKATNQNITFDGRLGDYSQGNGITYANLKVNNGQISLATNGVDTGFNLQELLPIVAMALMAVPGLGTAVGSAILPAGVSTATATAVGNAVVSAGMQVAAGVPVEQAITNAAVTLGVNQIVPNLSGNTFVDNAVKSVATAALTGGDVGTALANSLIATGGADLLGNASFTGDTVADSAIASAITGGVQAAATGGDVAQSIVQSALSGAATQINREEAQATRAASGAGFVGSDEDQAAVTNTVAGGAVADTVAGGATEADVLDLVAQDQGLTVDQSTNPLIAGQLVGAPTAGNAALVQTGLDTTTGAAGQDTVVGGQAGSPRDQLQEAARNGATVGQMIQIGRDNGVPANELLTILNEEMEGMEVTPNDLGYAGYPGVVQGRSGEFVVSQAMGGGESAQALTPETQATLKTLGGIIGLGAEDPDAIYRALFGGALGAEGGQAILGFDSLVLLQDQVDLILEDPSLSPEARNEITKIRSDIIDKKNEINQSVSSSLQEDITAASQLSDAQQNIADSNLAANIQTGGDLVSDLDANLGVTAEQTGATSDSSGASLTVTTQAVVLQNNNDGTALVLTQDGNATNVNATDSNTGNQLTAGDTVTVNNQDNTATTTTAITGGGRGGEGQQEAAAQRAAEEAARVKAEQDAAIAAELKRQQELAAQQEADRIAAQQAAQLAAQQEAASLAAEQAQAAELQRQQQLVAQQEAARQEAARQEAARQAELVAQAAADAEAARQQAIQQEILRQQQEEQRLQAAEAERQRVLQEQLAAQQAQQQAEEAARIAAEQESARVAAEQAALQEQQRLQAERDAAIQAELIQQQQAEQERLAELERVRQQDALLLQDTTPGGNLTDLTGGGVDLGGGDGGGGVGAGGDLGSGGGVTSGVTGGVTGGDSIAGGGGGEGGGGDLGGEVTDAELIDLITSDLITSDLDADTTDTTEITDTTDTTDITDVTDTTDITDTTDTAAETPTQDVTGGTKISVLPTRVPRPRPPPGSRVTEVDAAGLLPLRPGLSEGGTGGIEGTTEEEQKPVWNVRSLKLRRALGI